MIGFEPRISGVGSDRTTNCTTTTDHGPTKNNKNWGSMVVGVDKA